VRLFATHGASVVFGDIQDDLGEALAQTLKNLQLEVSYVHCDVRQEADVQRLVEFAVGKHGHLDIMYNNAGVVGKVGMDIKDVDIENVDAVYSVNLRGALLGTKHAARVMIPAKKGVILSTASTASFMPGTAPLPYDISKFALLGLVKSTACELAKHGIRVNCVSPHALPTPLTLLTYQSALPHLAYEEIEALILDSSELKGAALTTNDIANAALFLVSDDAKCITGHNLVVDCGFTSNKSYSPIPVQL
jgi:NAD(P)-dependent dehydrogenase (short-subunit alcohol dehydrogenase family)